MSTEKLNIHLQPNLATTHVWREATGSDQTERQRGIQLGQLASMREWLTANCIKRGALLYWSALFTMSTAIIHFINLLVQPPQSGVIAAFLLIGIILQAVIALAVVAFPARCLLMIAAIIQGGATVLWLIAHNTAGLPDGLTLWHPETLNVPDLYLPIMEGVSAFFFLCLFGRTWSIPSKAGRLLLNALPLLFILGVLIWAGVNYKIAEVIIALFFLDAGFPTSLQVFFLPCIGLLLVFLLLRFVLPRMRVATPKAWRTFLILLPALFVINVLTWAAGVSASNTAWFSPSQIVHAPAGQTTTLSYCRVGNNPLAMDISEPSASAVRPAPVVFYIHGGEALQGSRALLDGSADGVYFTKLRDNLLGRGFVVGSIDYGLAPLYGVQNEIKQAKCAIRFLREYANELGIDPQRVGVYGPSQGGYISAMLGTTGPQAGFDTGQYLNQSSQVQAVVDMWGPTDLADFSGSPSWVANLNQGLGASGSGAKARIRTISPVSYVAPHDPPFLIIHGTDDWFIAPHHSQNFAKLLHAAGVPVTLIMVQHDGHGLATPTAGQIEQPSPDTLIQTISDFFARTLKA